MSNQLHRPRRTNRPVRSATSRGLKNNANTPSIGVIVLRLVRHAHVTLFQVVLASALTGIFTRAASFTPSRGCTSNLAMINRSTGGGSCSSRVGYGGPRRLFRFVMAR